MIGNVGNDSGVPGVNIVMSLVGNKNVIAGLKQTETTLRSVASSANVAASAMNKVAASSKASAAAIKEHQSSYNKSMSTRQELLTTGIVNQRNHTDATNKNTKAQKAQAGMWKTTNPVINKTNNLLNSIRWTMVNVTFALMALGAVASPFILLTKQGMEYEEQLRKIATVSGEIYQTQKGIQSLTGAVAGVAIGRPATFSDAASAMLEFQRAGFSLTDAMRDVPHIIDLSVAGFTDLTSATKIVTGVLHQFSNQGLTAGEAVDTIAKAAVSSALTVEDFGAAIGHSGALAASAGFSFQETAAAIGLLANAGLRGSRAGTTLRQIIAKLNKVSKEGEDSMRRMGMSFYNTEGRIKSLQEIFSDLDMVMTGFTDAEKGDFISQMFEIRSRAGVEAILNLIQESSTAIDDFAYELSESGFAASMAADIQEASALKMKTAWGNLMVAMEPVASSFNNIFANLIEGVEGFSSRFLSAMRRTSTVGAVGELPITVQLISLVGAMKLVVGGTNMLTRSLLGVTGATNTFSAASFKASSAVMNSMGVISSSIGVNNAHTASINKAAMARMLANSTITTYTGSLATSVAAKKAAIVATKGLTGAVKGFFASLGPIGLTIMGIVGAVTLWNKANKTIYKQTEEQNAIIMEMESHIDSLQATEDKYTKNSLDNSASRVRALRLEAVAASEDFDNMTKDYESLINYIDANWWQRAFGRTPDAGKLFDIIPEDELRDITNFRPYEWLEDSVYDAQRLTGEISDQAAGYQYLLHLKNDEEAYAKLQEKHGEFMLDLQKEQLREEEKRVKKQEERENLLKDTVLLMDNYVQLYREGGSTFEALNNKHVESLVKQSGEFERIVELQEERERLQQLIDNGAGDETRNKEKLKDVQNDLDSILSGIVDKNSDNLTITNDMLESINEGNDSFERRLGIIENISGALDDSLADIRRKWTPEFNDIFDEFLDDEAMFGDLGSLDNMRRQLNALLDEDFTGGMGGRIRDLISDINSQEDEFVSMTNTLREVETGYFEASQAMNEFNREIKLIEAELEPLNDKLSRAEDEVSRLMGMRFSGETELDNLIFDVQQEISAAELASMGITDVYGFIEDSVNGVEGAFDGVVGSINDVESATKSSEDAYDHWRSTVQEHIRALINEGGNLAKSTTDAVTSHSRLLASVEQTGTAGSGGKTEQEQMYDALTKARDHYYGGMHEKLGLAEQAQEDLSGVHKGTADDVIDSLQEQWDIYDKVIPSIDKKEESLYKLRNETDKGAGSMHDLNIEMIEEKNRIDDIVENLTGPGGLVFKTADLSEKHRDLQKDVADAELAMNNERTEMLKSSIASSSLSVMHESLSGNILGVVSAIMDENGLLDAMSEEGSRVETLIKKYNRLARSRSDADVSLGISGSGGGSDNGGIPSGPNQNMSPVSGISNTAFLDLPLIKSFDDFVMRPNSAPVGFHPDDTIIGAKDPEALFGGSGGDVHIQNINITGSSTSNPKDMARQLVKEIRREMRVK